MQNVKLRDGTLRILGKRGSFKRYLTLYGRSENIPIAGKVKPPAGTYGTLKRCLILVPAAWAEHKDCEDFTIDQSSLQLFERIDLMVLFLPHIDDPMNHA